MSMQDDQLAFDGFYQPSSFRGSGPYEPSIASTASSSQASIFSESSSTQSSIASSVSDDFRTNQQEEARDRAYAQLQIHIQASQNGCKQSTDHIKVEKLIKAACPVPPSYADVTSAQKEHRQHPRRSSLARHQKPPTLVRQCDRKGVFVESLVDSATQMVEVVWPMSVVPCQGEGSTGRGVLPLRTYIEETLRRSRTSYSTLQVALYYLIMIKPFVPKNDSDHEQATKCPANRALLCGRRMFLAALILASKYLQDRNYSSKAWSKMSGLKASEINTNERTFLSKVNWKLHIPETIFKKWAEIVLKYIPSNQPPSPGASLSIPTASWKDIIPLLTPELEHIPIPESKTPSIECPANYGFSSPVTPIPPKSALAAMHIDSTSHESTPTPLTVVPRFLEPRPDMQPPTPALARMGPLPTPNMTPSSIASSTPAASACSSRRPSMSMGSAMAMCQKVDFNRCTMDAFPTRKNDYPFASRRPSVASSRSSPESMISDRSRSSRASSISSISTVSSASSVAPSRACLARQATCRSARLPIPPATVTEEKEGTATQPIIVSDDMEMVTSPDLVDFTISEKVLHTPHRHSKHGPGPVPTSAPTAEKNRKRCRPRSGRRSDLQEEVRRLREEATDELMDVDDGIVDLTLSPSPAAVMACKMLARSSTFGSTKQVQPPASLLRAGSGRMPVQSCDGSKRHCCSSTAMSISPPRLYGEIA